MAKSKKRDFLEQSAGFMAAFRVIQAKGFFEGFAVATRSDYQGHIYICTTANGKLPDSKTDSRRGIKPYTDAVAVIKFIRSQVSSGNLKIKFHKCKVEATNWPKWNRSGEKVIGRLGSQVSLELTLIGNDVKKKT